MSNWFEQNATKSIVTYTSVVAGVTWAVSRYILSESKFDLYRAQIENCQSAVGQYKAKIDVVEREAAILRQENERYLSWLQGAPNTFPSLAHRIEELEGEKGDLLTKTSACVNNGKVSASVTPGGYSNVGEALRG